LPQRISLTFHGKLGGESSPAQFEIPVPRIQAWPVQKTLWSVWTPPERGLPVCQAGESLTVEQLQLERYTELAAVLENGIHSLADLISAEREVWLRVWQRRVNITGQLLEDALEGLADHPRFEQTWLNMQEVARRLKQLQAKISARADLGDPQHAELDFISPPELWTWRGSLEHAPLCRMMTGAEQHCAVQFTAQVPLERQSRIFLAAGGFLVMAAVSIFAARTPLGTWPGQHPWAILVLAAAGWWLFLQPREISLMLLVLAGLVWLLKRRETATL
jgi:hypothetical protein